MDLSGKRAIVLGGTSGIGLAAVRQLVAAGAKVTAGSRSADNVEAASKAVPDASFERIDVLDRPALEALFDRHQGFDILVNAAYGGERATGGSWRWIWTPSRVPSGRSGATRTPSVTAHR